MLLSEMTGMALAVLAAGGWTEFPRTNAPPPLEQEATYYVGHRLIVVGRAGDAITGSVFDFDQGRWTRIRPLEVEKAQAPPFFPELPRAQPLGDELLFFFGQVPPEPSEREWPYAAGARYDFKRDAWRPLRREGALPAAGASLIKWERSRLIVFRAAVEDEEPPMGGVGAIYDAAGDAWTPLESAGAPRIPPEQTSWNATFAGHHLLLFGRVRDVRFRRPANPPRGKPPRPTGAEPGFIDFSYDLEKRTWHRLPLGAPRDSYIPIAVSEGRRALVLGGDGENGNGMEGGDYDPETDRWVPLENPPPMHVRTLTQMDRVLFSEFCVEGREESIGYVLFHLDSRRWSKTRQRTFQCGNVIVWDEHSLLIAETVMARKGLVPLHRYDPVRDVWYHAQIPAGGSPAGPVTLGGFGAQLAIYPEHLHWDGRRVILWGGANFAKDRPDACEAKAGPNAACAEAPKSPHTGYWLIPRWR